MFLRVLKTKKSLLKTQQTSIDHLKMSIIYAKIEKSTYDFNIICYLPVIYVRFGGNQNSLKLPI